MRAESNGRCTLSEPVPVTSQAMLFEAPRASVSALPAVERYRILRDQLQQQDGLTAQRLSWLMASQAFLFTAYAITVNGPERAKNALIGSRQDPLLGIIPAVGLLSTALIYVGLIAGIVAMFSIQRLARGLFDGGEASHFPPLQRARLTRCMGLAASLIPFPPLCTGADKRRRPSRPPQWRRCITWPRANPRL
jgi:hypothetical protein